jgi:hypothetical protein
MQQTSPGTSGNTNDNLCSRNTRISCSSLTTKHIWYIHHSKNLKPHLKACRSKYDYEKFSKQLIVAIDSDHADNGAFRSETSKKSIEGKNQRLHFSCANAQWQKGLVERSNGTLCEASRSMLNHAISRWDANITAELWPFAIQHSATIYNTTTRSSRDYDLIPWEKVRGERSKLDQTDMHPLFCPVYVLDRRMQEGASPPKWTT